MGQEQKKDGKKKKAKPEVVVKRHSVSRTEENRRKRIAKVARLNEKIKARQARQAQRKRADDDVRERLREQWMKETTVAVNTKNRSESFAKWKEKYFDKLAMAALEKGTVTGRISAKEPATSNTPKRDYTPAQAKQNDENIERMSYGEVPPGSRT